MPRRAANAKKDTSTPQKRRISGWRKWLFRALAATIGPAICLLGLEFGLQLFGYGHSPDFFMKLESGDAYTTNPRFGYRFFPSSMAREPAPCRLPARKADNTYRIIILGGSAARGTPDWTLGFGRFLQAMLQQARPDMKFEVVNAAMTAINSHVVLPIARDAAEHDPDLFVVYMGNNEVVGPYGTAAMFGDFSPNLTLIRTGIYVNSTRTGQLIKSLFASAGADKTQWDGMQMFLDRQVAASDPKLQDAYKHFRSNLNEICNVAQDAETPMILCTVATNLKDSAPFASMHRDGMTEAQLKQWSDLVRSAQTSADDGDHDQAVETYRKAAELDDRHAELHFRMAHSLLAALNLAASSRKSRWALKKNERRGPNWSTSSPASRAACT